MDDLDLRDLLSPPMRYRAEWMDGKRTPDNERIQVLAMASVPNQKWRHLMEPEEALCRGTIFRELDLPFEGRPGV